MDFSHFYPDQKSVFYPLVLDNVDLGSAGWNIFGFLFWKILDDVIWI